MGKKNKLFGNRDFYMMVLTIALPIAIQNGFTNFVNLLDNIMVGRLGTEAMSGVSIANQLVFIFNICIFGCVSGAGIFTAQYVGKEDWNGVRNTVRYKLITGSLITILCSILCLYKGDYLIGLFLKGSSDGGNVDFALQEGRSYLNLMLLGFPAFMLSQVYASTSRENGEAVTPMKAGLTAIVTNLVLNYLLIFGHFGLPRLGVRGAAIATTVSRYIEAAIVIIWTHRTMEFTKGLYRKLTLPSELARKITKAAIPLLMNETLWATGMTFLVQCYSTRGLNAVAGYNIFSTLLNVFNVSLLAIGNSVGIIIGRLLGAERFEDAKDTDRKIIVFAMLVGASLGVIMLSLSYVFPLLYNTNDIARTTASHLIIAQSFFLPLFALKNSTYYTLRSGGQIWITIIFDSVFLWFCSVPIAFTVSRFTSFSVVGIFIAVQMGDFIKCTLGLYLIKKGVWIRKIVA
ncbi:MAG: MATE family efflux transporter [Sphaerochaetaceae bacterium]|nr:MATE family efflux transporter [Sphaerochaetaceae bacterium]